MVEQVGGSHPSSSPPPWRPAGPREVPTGHERPVIGKDVAVAVRTSESSKIDRITQKAAALRRYFPKHAFSKNFAQKTAELVLQGGGGGLGTTTGAASSGAGPGSLGATPGGGQQGAGAGGATVGGGFGVGGGGSLAGGARSGTLKDLELGLEARLADSPDPKEPVARTAPDVHQSAITGEKRLQQARSLMKEETGLQTPEWVHDERRYLRLHDVKPAGDVNAASLNRRLDQYSVLQPGNLRKGVPTLAEFEAVYGPAIEQRGAALLARKSAATAANKDSVAPGGAPLASLLKLPLSTTTAPKKATASDLVESLDDANAQLLCRKLANRSTQESRIPKNVHTRYGREQEDQILQRGKYRPTSPGANILGRLSLSSRGRGSTEDSSALNNSPTAHVVPSPTKQSAVEQTTSQQSASNDDRGSDGTTAPAMDTSPSRKNKNKFAAAVTRMMTETKLANVESAVATAAQVLLSEDPLFAATEAQLTDPKAADLAGPMAEYRKQCDGNEVPRAEGMEKVFREVEKFRNLHLRNLELSVMHVHCICRVLENLPSAQFLTVADCLIPDKGIEMLLATCCETLTSLHLEQVNLSLVSIELLYKALYPRRKECVLQHLFLKGCGLGSEDEIPGYNEWDSEDDEPDEYDDSDFDDRELRGHAERPPRFDDEGPEAGGGAMLNRTYTPPPPRDGPRERGDGRGDRDRDNYGYNDHAHEFPPPPKPAAEGGTDVVTQQLRAEATETGEAGAYTDNDPTRADNMLQDEDSLAAENSMISVGLFTEEGGSSPAKAGGAGASGDHMITRREIMGSRAGSRGDHNRGAFGSTQNFDPTGGNDPATGSTYNRGYPLEDHGFEPPNSRGGPRSASSNSFNDTVGPVSPMHLRGTEREEPRSRVADYAMRRERSTFQGLGQNTYAEHQLGKYWLDTVTAEEEEQKVVDGVTGYRVSATPTERGSSAATGSSAGHTEENGGTRPGSSSATAFGASLDGRGADHVEQAAGRAPSRGGITTEEATQKVQGRAPNPNDPSQRAMPRQPPGANQSMPDDGRFLRKLDRMGGLPERSENPGTPDKTMKADDPRRDPEYATSPVLEWMKSPECKKLQETSPVKGAVKTSLPPYKKRRPHGIEAGDVPKELLEPGTRSAERVIAQLGTGGAGSRGASRQGSAASGSSAATLFPERRDQISGDRNVPGVRRHKLRNYQDPEQAKPKSREAKLWSQLRRYLQGAKGMGIRANIPDRDENDIYLEQMEGKFGLVNHYTRRCDPGKKDLSLVLTKQQLKKEREYYRGVKVRAVPDGAAMFSHALDVLRVSSDWNGYPPDVWLGENESEVEGYPIVMPLLAISMVTQLHTLDLSENVLSPRGWSVFEQLLGRTKTLEVLTVDETGLSDLCIHPFCSGLKHNVTLKALSMRSVMLLRDESLILLLQTLEKHPALVMWNFLDNVWGEKMLGGSSEEGESTRSVKSRGNTTIGGTTPLTASRAPTAILGGGANGTAGTAGFGAGSVSSPTRSRGLAGTTTSTLGGAGGDGATTGNKGGNYTSEAPTVISAFRDLLNKSALLSCIHMSLPECKLQHSLLKERGWFNWFRARSVENVVIWRALFCRDFYPFPRTRPVAEAEKRQLSNVLTKHEKWERGGYRELAENTTNATGLFVAVAKDIANHEARLQQERSERRAAARGMGSHGETQLPTQQSKDSIGGGTSIGVFGGDPQSPTAGVKPNTTPGVFDAANKDFSPWYCDPIEAPGHLLTLPHLEANKQFLQPHCSSAVAGSPPSGPSGAVPVSTAAQLGQTASSTDLAASFAANTALTPPSTSSSTKLKKNVTTSGFGSLGASGEHEADEQRAVEYFESSYNLSVGSRQGRRGSRGAEARGKTRSLSADSVDTEGLAVPPGAAAGEHGTTGGFNANISTHSSQFVSNVGSNSQVSGTQPSGSQQHQMLSNSRSAGDVRAPARSRTVISKRPPPPQPKSDYFKNHPPQMTKSEQIEKIMLARKAKEEKEKEKAAAALAAKKHSRSAAQLSGVDSIDVSQALSLSQQSGTDASILKAGDALGGTHQSGGQHSSLGESVKTTSTDERNYLASLPLGHNVTDYHALQRQTQVVPHPLNRLRPSQIRLSKSWVSDRCQQQEFVWNFPKSGSISGHSVHLVPSFYDYTIIPMNLVLQTNRNHVFRVGALVPSYCQYVFYFFYDPATQKLFYAKDQPHLKIRPAQKHKYYYRDCFLKSVSKAVEANIDKPGNAPGGAAENVTSLEAIFGLFDITHDFPDFVNYRKVDFFRYPCANPTAQVELHERAPDVGEVYDKSLVPYQRDFIDDEETRKLEECYLYDIDRISLKAICGANEEKKFQKRIGRHYLELYQTYALLTGGELNVRSVDVMAFFDEVCNSEISSRELMKFIEAVGHSAVRFFRHEFVHLCLMVGLSLYPQPKKEDAPKSLTMLVENRFRKAIAYPLNPFSKRVMQDPVVNKMTYDCMEILKDAYLRYGTHKSGFMQLIYILRINDSKFTARHLACIFALAQKYKPKACEQTEHECTRMTYPEFCEAIVRIAAGGIPQEEKRYRGVNLSLHLPKLVKVCRAFCERIQTKIRENIRRMNQYKIS